jgi:hypothetical protein
MALVYCIECHGSVSDQAHTCPHCGHPLKKPETRILETGQRGDRVFDQAKLDALLKEGWEITNKRVYDEYYNADGQYTCLITYTLKRYN